jgi:hypothetical protein
MDTIISGDKMSKRYVVKLTLDQAKRLGIVDCKNCEHPINNHFDFGYAEARSCARCECKKFKVRFCIGKEIKRK